MNSKIAVKFVATGLEVKLDATLDMPFNILIENFFKSKNKTVQDCKDKIFFSLGSSKKIEYNDTTKLSDLKNSLNSKSKNFPPIFVSDPNNILVKKADRKQMRKERKIIEDVEKKEQETTYTVLAKMAEFGCECSNKAIYDKGEDVEFKTYDEAIAERYNKDGSHSFLLGLIGKYIYEELDTEVFINIDPSEADEEEKKNAVTTLRYLSNGLMTKRKSSILIKTTCKINELNSNKKKCKQINDKLKSKFVQTYKELNEKTFVVTNFPDAERYHCLLVSPTEGSFELTEADAKLKGVFAYEGTFGSNVPEVEGDLPLLDTIILNKDFLMPQFDSNDDSKLGYGEKRGKEDYIPPVGWWRWGAVAYGQYGSDNGWLSYDQRSWCVAYIGLSSKEETENKVKKFEKDEDVKHNGQKVGLGVLVYQDPNKMEEDCVEIETNGEVYKIGFMLRVRPDAIRQPKSGNGKYWVVNGTADELRPYSILSKRVK